MEKIPSPKELLAIWKRLTPEQRKLIQTRISDMVARYRRSQFKLIPGRRQQQALTAGMNCLAAELAELKPNDPRRAGIVKELSELSLVSASAKGRTSDG
jgi:hypothetical protein